MDLTIHPQKYDVGMSFHVNAPVESVQPTRLEVVWFGGIAKNSIGIRARLGCLISNQIFIQYDLVPRGRDGGQKKSMPIPAASVMTRLISSLQQREFPTSNKIGRLKYEQLIVTIGWTCSFTE
jgi:hypothetical protein